MTSNKTVKILRTEFPVAEAVASYTDEQILRQIEQNEIAPHL